MLAIVAIACCVLLPIVLFAVAGVVGVFGEDKRDAVNARGAALRKKIRNAVRRGAQ